MRLLINHCGGMVDIETLGLTPSSKIVSVGAVLFDPYRLNSPEELFNGYTFYANVDPDSQPQSTTCPDTMEWWSRQSEAARGALSANKQPIDVVLRELHNFLCFRQQDSHPPAHELWANGPNFDCVILEHAYRMYGNKFTLPVPFNRQYCVRSIKRAAWPAGDAPQLNIGVAHNALDDCVKQAMLVQMAHAELGHSKHT